MRDKEKQRKWNRENTKAIVGVRVSESIAVWELVNQQLYLEQVEPTMFFYHKNRREPYILWPTQRRFHIPVSLTKRARIVVNVHSNKIIAKTDKCFKL